MSKVIILTPEAPPSHRCPLPSPVNAGLVGSVALCPDRATWYVCISRYIEHFGFDRYWRKVRPWDHKAKSLIRNHRKDTP